MILNLRCFDGVYPELKSKAQLYWILNLGEENA
jgi:hypothetical protein